MLTGLARKRRTVGASALPWLSLATSGLPRLWLQPEVNSAIPHRYLIPPSRLRAHAESDALLAARRRHGHPRSDVTTLRGTFIAASVDGFIDDATW